MTDVLYVLAGWFCFSFALSFVLGPVLARLLGSIHKGDSP